MAAPARAMPPFLSSESTMSNDLDQSAGDRFLATAIPTTPPTMGSTGLAPVGVILAWFGIGFLVAAVLGLHTISRPEEATASGQGLDVRLMQMQARYLVGTKDLGAPGKDLYRQAQVQSMN